MGEWEGEVVSYGINKKDNGYARLVLDIDAPKTVWMAIAVSLANRIDGVGAIERGGTPTDTIMAEWQALYDNGIVPQRPRREKLSTGTPLAVGPQKDR